MTRATTVNPEVPEPLPDWAGDGRAALEGALAAERLWPSERESLTEAIFAGSGKIDPGFRRLGKGANRES